MNVNYNRLLRTAFSNTKKKDPRKLQANVGDIVRISKQKGMFEKGFAANWSPELSRVTHVRESEPRTYYFEDLDHKPIRGGFYAEEIQPTLYPDTYLVEKIIK